MAFFYDGFTQADITSISWTLDPATDAVVALDLNALQGDNLCPIYGTDCSNRTASLSPTLALGGRRELQLIGASAAANNFLSSQISNLSWRRSLRHGR